MPATPPTTHLLLNGDVRTVDAVNRRASALAWRDGSIVAVGSDADVTRIAGAGAVRHDLRGATVLPGFIDAHQHPSLAAVYELGVRLAPPNVHDIASLQATLAAAAARLPPITGSTDVQTPWLVASGWDESLLAERRAPTRKELDDAVPDRPLFAMHYSYHRAVVNSRALEWVGIGKHTTDPAGGRISRGRGGLPTGLLLERAMGPVESRARTSLVARDPEGLLARLRAHYRTLVDVGITRVVDSAVTPDLMTIYRELARRGEVLVPTVMMPVSGAGYLDAPWDALDGVTTGERRGEGHDHLETGPLKLIFDGAPLCAMCLRAGQSLAVFFRTFALAIQRGSWDPVRTALSVDARLSRDGTLRSGITFYKPDEARRIVAAAVDRGFSVATHAEGNDAVALTVKAYESTGSALGRYGVPRIEHGIFLEQELVPRIAALGCTVVAQPPFVALPAFGDAPAVPGLPGMPLRWLLDGGVNVAGSSDFPVVGVNPLDGIRAAVTRRTRRGEIYEPAQAISLDEAFALYTRAAAIAAGCADRCGSLTVGKRADVVVLNRAVGTVNDLDDAQVEATVIGGAVVAGALR